MNAQSPCQLFEDLCECNENFMEVLSEKINKYKLDNPLDGRAAGEYANAKIQNTYDEFVSSPDRNLKNILQFALNVEEKSILLIEEQIEIARSEEMKVIYNSILDEANCQVKFINDKINQRDSSETTVPANILY